MGLKPIYNWGEQHLVGRSRCEESLSDPSKLGQQVGACCVFKSRYLIYEVLIWIGWCLIMIDQINTTSLIYHSDLLWTLQII